MAGSHLSASMEDYLEAIFHILAEKKAVRAKDIAERLNVTRPSVSGALQSLAKAGLVNHEPYDVITLTNDGIKAAEEVIRRHEALHEFFVSVLDVNEEEAQSASCAMEHAVSPNLLNRLVAFVRYIKCRPQTVQAWRNEIKNQGKRSLSMTGKKETILADIRSGNKVRMVRTNAGHQLQTRLVGMGLIPGVELEILRNDLKGPVVVAVKGARVALGRSMTKKIMVTDVKAAE